LKINLSVCCTTTGLRQVPGVLEPAVYQTFLASELPNSTLFIS